MGTPETFGSTGRELSDRVDTVGWGALFVAVGVTGLVPDLPRDAWLIAAGVVMVGLSATRAALRLPVRAPTTVLGIVALTAGIGSLAGLSGATGPVVLIVLGVAIVIDPLYRSLRRTGIRSPSSAT